MKKILVLTKPTIENIKCVMCERVEQFLERNNIAHSTEWLLDPVAPHEVTKVAKPYYELAKQRNIQSAPIVVVLDEQDEIVDMFGGYNPIKLKELKHV